MRRERAFQTTYMCVHLVGLVVFGVIAVASIVGSILSFLAYRYHRMKRRLTFEPQRVLSVSASAFEEVPDSH